MADKTLTLLTPGDDLVVPSDADFEEANAKRNRIIALGRESDDIFKKQLDILWEFHLNPRLLKALDYDSLYEMCQDPEIWRALKMKIASPSQFYPLMNLAQVNHQYPNLPWGEVEKISELTHRPKDSDDDVVGKLIALSEAKAPEKQARKVWDDHFSRADKPIDVSPKPEVREDEFVLSEAAIMRHGKAVVALDPGWWKSAEMVRAVSMIIHLPKPPSVIVTDGKNITVATSSKGMRRLGRFTTLSSKSDVNYLCVRARAQVIKNI